MGAVQGNDALDECFLKIIETIQGDERDVMMISTLYGPKAPGAKVFQRFGPINSTHDAPFSLKTDARRLRICDSQGRPLNFFVTAGQVSDDIGPRALLSSLPDVDWLIAGRCYDADRFRKDLKDRGIRACIPGRKQRKTPV